MTETPSSPVEEPPIERLPQKEAPDQGLTLARRRAALAIAVTADVIQWAAAPLFFWGAASTLDDVLDVVVAIALIRLVGFHWVLLPAFVAEIVPFVDLVPTWTVAVWLATRGRTKPGL
jgi:hypothetical protein